jgi:hypothetical protein
MPAAPSLFILIWIYIIIESRPSTHESGELGEHQSIMSSRACDALYMPI